MSIKPHIIAPNQTLFGGERIGEALDAVHVELTYCGSQLRSLLQGRAEKMQRPLMRMLDELQNQFCTISVVGQVKAGKSSFINALIRRPGLLPSDVNPSTKTITRLHFGKPGAAASGGVFEFFTEEEWNTLSHGSPQLRALTERLMPDFRIDLLRRQFETMRQSIETRLGGRFRHLLGKTHEFDEITLEILERYVCGDSPTPEEPQGNFADVTKCADLFFPLSPFGYPTTLIDTPGVNDAFMAQDEAIRRNLDAADVHIVLLTAQQALSNADMDLMRLLDGLNKHRIIVFVNRIDQLNDPVQDAHTITSYVQNLLSKEFPHWRIPVVAGSAFWGQAAIEAGWANPKSLFSPAFAQAARSAGLASKEDFVRWRAGSADGEDGARLSRALLVCSGLPKAIACISETMLTGHGAIYIRSAAACLRGVAQALQRTSEAELEGLAPPEIAGADETNQRARRGADAMSSLVVKIESIATRTSRAMKADRDEGLDKLKERLDSVMHFFADEEAAQMLKVMDDNPMQRVWTCEVRWLRRALEREFLDVYQDISRQLYNRQHAAATQIHLALYEAAPETKIAEPHDLLILNPIPSLTALSRPAAFDLDPRLWGIWWRRRRSPQEKAAELRRMIREDFQDVINALIASANKGINVYIMEVSERIIASSLRVARLARDRQQTFSAVADGHEPAEESALHKQKAERASSCRDVIAGCDDLLKRIDMLVAGVSRKEC